MTIDTYILKAASKAAGKVFKAKDIHAVKVDSGKGVNFYQSTDKKTLS